MTSTTNRDRGAGGPQVPAWSAVASMTIGVFSLVTAEFLPASLLTPIAADLSISEGSAGQAVTTTALFGFVTSLLITAAARGTDRRKLLMFFSTLLVASNLLVAFAPGLPLLLAGRVLLGAAIGGFWTMAAAVTMRLVPPVFVPRALSILFSGVSAATILAAPLGSFLGDLAGWRSVFLLAAGLGALTLVVQFVTLPSMPPIGLTRLKVLAEVMARPGIRLAMATVTLVFAGHFAFFTYLRPFLEETTSAGGGIGAVSVILLGFGLSNFIGTLLAGPMLERSLRLTLTGAPLMLGLLALMLVSVGEAPVIGAAIVAVWGLAFGAVPVAWSTWLTRAVPDQAETAGGLLVAAIQFSIALGAAAGGVIFDASGVTGVFMISGVALLVAGLTILAGVRPPAVVPAE